MRAINRHGIQSPMRTLDVQYVPPQRELYLVALGVAEYESKDLRLNSPVKDVDALIETFQAQEDLFYHRVRVQKLVNASVTGPAVEKIRARFLSRAQPEDTIIVFVAGHGVRGEGGEYWFLTSTATPEEPFTGIKRQNLESLVTWNSLRAHRRVMLIDTCHSGAAPDHRSARGLDLFRQRDVNRLIGKGGGGLYVLAASGDDELARETEENGIFTRAILDGLSGAADDPSSHTGGNGNGYVEIEELKRYAEIEVARLSQWRQRPMFGTVKGGKNFPLARVRE